LSKAPTLSPAQIEQICRVLADTNNGLTHAEISSALTELRIHDCDPNNTKWRRLHHALVNRVNNVGKTNVVYGLILYCFDPARGLMDVERYRWMMSGVNRILMLSGIEIQDDGQLHKVQTAQRLSEVQQRTRELRAKLIASDAHAEVLKYCREELLDNDYFHAVHEAAKGLCDRVRTMTGLDLDGTRLFDAALSTRDPYIELTDLKAESGRNQQNGLREMLNGVMHLVRNPTAHELRIHWDVNEKDALDVLNLISYLHKLLDCCDVVRRAS